MGVTDTERLSEKVVINLCDGKNLGYICDVQFTVEQGQIVSVIVPEEQGLFSFGKGNKIIIPWDKIECIGEDAVLVKIVTSECCRQDNCNKGKGKRRFWWG